MRTHDKGVTLANFQIGKKQAMTPEGYLLCQEVPIARTGTQDYLAEELAESNIEGGRDGIVKVDRNEADVFHPDTIASFNGKDVTDDHPDALLNPGTVKEHSVGVLLNPRRGEGADSDLLIADLLIKDADAIQAVRDGKREVSCGYDAQYEQLEPGRARQHTIIGNHVALVDRGRCGHRCSIGDEDMTTKKVSWYDRAVAAFTLNNRAAFDEALEEAKKETKDVEDPSDGKIGIHLHMGSGPAHGGTTIAPTADEEDPENKSDKHEARFKKIEEGMDAMRKDMKGIHDAIMKKTKDSVEEEEGEAEAEGEETGDAESEKEDKEEKGEKDRKGAKDKKGTGDSASLKTAFQAARAGAEILSPGLKLATFDAAMAPKATMDAMCTLRRRAIRRHLEDDAEGALTAVELTGSTKLNLGTMTCDSVGLLFNGLVSAAKARNGGGTMDLGHANPPGNRGARTGSDKVPQTIAELNEMNRQRFDNTKH